MSVLLLTLKKQNAKLQVMLNRTGAGTSSNSEGVPKLPINSTEQLRDADTKLKEAFIRGIFVQDLKVLKGHDGPEKTLAWVFSDQLLATYNWDGRKGHSALKAFETVVDSIFDGLQTDGFGRKSFETAIRGLISSSHQRTNMANFRERKKMQQ